WAQRYEHADGVPRDYDRAVELYCAAAREGFAPAQYWLGWMYANARGVSRDDGLAAAWFKLSAGQGDVQAQRMLGYYNDEEKSHEPRCIRTTGSEYLEPLKSVPNPSPLLIRKWVKQLSPKYGLDSGLVLAVIQAESNFNPRARSPKNAQGLMQLIPATAKRFGVKDILDPLDNLRGGMAYLQWLLNYFDGNVTYALAGYNAGERAVERYGGIPPYSETRAYVRQVQRTVTINALTSG
ncbi:MAG: transglycosylase SLT domain-containing protein, partial [Gammaproteobacteria bacterium]|nr:transglycosylase SLT domain-containing protein [Gammaproteobacteria bacterium]